LPIGVIFDVLAWMGFELLETARAVAEFDVPMRVLGLFWASHHDALKLVLVVPLLIRHDDEPP